MKKDQDKPAIRRFSPKTFLWAMPLVASILLPGTGRTVREQPMAARIDQAVVMTAIVAAVALIVLTVFFYGFGRRLHWAFGMTAVMTLVLFQWPWLTAGGEAVTGVIPIGLLRDIFPVAVAGALLWLSGRIAHESGFAIMTGISLWALVITFIAMSIPYVQTSFTDRGAATPGSPDVVLIILDGYPRADVLASGFGFDNTGFVSELETRGFYVADQARSNYSYTFASVSTMFEMDYVIDLGPIDSEEESIMRTALGGESVLVGEFRSRGYTVALAENQWEGSHCGPGIDLCVRDGIVERSVWNLGQSSILAPLFDAIRPHPFNSVSLSHLKQLATIVDSSSDDAPMLTVAHILLPHPPLHLDAECNSKNDPVRRDLVTRTEEQLEVRAQFFRDQLTCINRLVLEQLDRILANDDDTVVMITGDHGYTAAVDIHTARDTYTPASIVERMSILSAYRMPECRDLTYPQMTPVNGIRAVASCALDLDFAPLPDISRWVTNEGDREVTSLDDVLP